MERKCSLVLAVFGRYASLTYLLQRKIEQIKRLKGKCEVLVVLDGPDWSAVPMLQLLEVQADWVDVVTLPETTCLPAAVFNAGIKAASGEYIIFSTLCGVDPNLSVDLFQRCMDKEKTDREEEIVPVYYLHPDRPREGSFFLEWALYSQCMTHDCLHIDEWCVPKALWEQIGGFSESPWLQEEFERYAALTFLRYGRPVPAGVLSGAEASGALSLLPMERRLVKNRDLARRYALYCNAVSLPPRDHDQCRKQFLLDLRREEMEQFAAAEGLTPAYDPAAKHYRIFVIGGYWEYHHNQLCFFNYLENMYGSGFATFNYGLDVLVQTPELQGYDLVAFTRCRSDHSLTLMRWCRENSVASVYVIDDNWFSIRKDYPEQGKNFAPGKPDFDNFIEALTLCKTTLVYNPIIREAVMPYSASVQMFSISVCANTFSSPSSRERTDDMLYVGFAGSLRWNDMAFQALARMARRRKNVKIVLAGVLSKEQELLFKGLDTVRLPLADYSVYAKNMAALRPDLLIAPLEDTVTTRSKCANKYIEAGIVGAAGLFSKMEPYESVVRDGVNGFFVEEETAEGWYQALEKILRDIPKLRKVQQNAQKDVLENFSVKRLVPAFREKIISFIEQEELSDD